MKFKKLNEEFLTEYVNKFVNRVSYRDPIKQQYADFINDTIWDALDNIDVLAHSKIEGLPDTTIEVDSKEFMDEEDAIYNFVKVKTDNYFANTVNESLEANDEDGWGEDVRFALADMFDSVDRLSYEVNHCVRGSYTRVDTVEELVDKIRSVSSGFEAVADELENQQDELQEDANDFYKNEPSEDFDASSFIGKPLKDFLKTIDHRTKINISSEEGYDSNGGKGDTAGMSGLAHDAGWYLADKLITDIKVPQDKRFYDYSIFIEGLEGE